MLFGKFSVISFLRGQLINHGTPPQLTEIQSNPIAPRFGPGGLIMPVQHILNLPDQVGTNCCVQQIPTIFCSSIIIGRGTGVNRPDLFTPKSAGEARQRELRGGGSFPDLFEDNSFQLSEPSAG